MCYIQQSVAFREWETGKYFKDKGLKIIPWEMSSMRSSTKKLRVYIRNGSFKSVWQTLTSPLRVGSVWTATPGMSQLRRGEHSILGTKELRPQRCVLSWSPWREIEGNMVIASIHHQLQKGRQGMEASGKLQPGKSHTADGTRRWETKTRQKDLRNAEHRPGNTWLWIDLRSQEQKGVVGWVSVLTLVAGSLGDATTWGTTKSYIRQHRESTAL